MVDALYNKEDYCGDSVFIFKGISSDTKAKLFYARLFKQRDFCVGNEDEWEKGVGVIGGEFYPATKEQRDQLEKAMTDAGYTFDFEKKELKKIEQNPAWSEEDEMFVHGLIRGLAAKRNIHGHTTFSSDCIDITETINWLNSLKDRVQPKQEWDEEDEENITNLCTIIYDSCNAEDASRLIEWLNSLRPQNRWKPSEEQTEVLQELIRNYTYDKHTRDIAWTLYHNIMALKH